MRNLGDAWDYLTTGANWGGSDGMWHLMVQQLLLSLTALLAAMVIGLTLALWLGHLGRAGFLSVNITNVGRAVPTFALLAILVTLDHPGTATFGPYGRAGLGDPDRSDLVRAATALHERVRRGPRGPGSIKESASGHGHDAAPSCSGGSSCRLALPLMVSGIRLALVQVWATATIAALVAGPGLGSLITEGFYRTDYPKGIAARDRRRGRGSRARGRWRARGACGGPES